EDAQRNGCFRESCVAADTPDLSLSGPRQPRFDRTEMGPLTHEHRPRICEPGRWSARPRLTRSGPRWTPEELLVGSLNTCIMLTFVSLAQARGLTPTGCESEAEGLLENVEGKYRITEVTVRPHITVKGGSRGRPCP